MRVAPGRTSTRAKVSRFGPPIVRSPVDHTGYTSRSRRGTDPLFFPFGDLCCLGLVLLGRSGKTNLTGRQGKKKAARIFQLIFWSPASDLITSVKTWLANERRDASTNETRDSSAVATSMAQGGHAIRSTLLNLSRRANVLSSSPRLIRPSACGEICPCCCLLPSLSDLYRGP